MSAVDALVTIASSASVIRELRNTIQEMAERIHNEHHGAKSAHDTNYIKASTCARKICRLAQEALGEPHARMDKP